MRAKLFGLGLVLVAAACSPPPPARIDSGVRDSGPSPIDSAADVTRSGADAFDAPAIDVSSVDTGTDASDADAEVDAFGDATSDATDVATCFSGTPTTRLEFLNRCTDAATTDKTVVLPLLRPDGTLPPLP